jgi:hypothetical protein
MAGPHVISVLLLNELYEVTGEPSAAILPRLAILAERGRGTPFAGWARGVRSEQPLSPIRVSR